MKQNDLGGKGASLFKLKENNYNVPGFFVLDTTFFDEFLEENNIKDTIDNLLSVNNLKFQQPLRIENNLSISGSDWRQGCCPY